MYLFHLFRSFLPLHNTIGFGAVDFIELALALILLALSLACHPWLETRVSKFAMRTGWCMALLAAVPIVLRLFLLPHYPMPTANVSDDFSFLLLADTLRHFRLANPAHPLHQFFETYFVLQEPAYSSIFPLGQGIILAIGWTVFGNPWAGVALSMGAFCALCYWMLRAWTTPLWALLGGLLATIEFGPLNQWMNSFWGGAVAASAGCLVFGSLPRLREEYTTRRAVFLGLGLAVHLLVRPYETTFLILSVLLFCLQRPQKYRKAAVVASLVVLPALSLILLQDRQVTGNWTMLPYMLSRYQYGVPATLTFQPNPTPHRDLTPQQKLDYEIQVEAHDRDTYLERLGSRVRFYRYFLLAPLYVALPFFLLRLRDLRYAWVVATILLFALGTNFYPYFYSHYIGACACLFVLVSVVGLNSLGRWNTEAARVILLLCAAHFLFWYGIHLLASEDIRKAMAQFETWDALNHGDPEGRIAVNEHLAQAPGNQLVFVRYSSLHQFHEWVHNSADIDSSRVVWARDLGPTENEKLRQYFLERTVWLLEPDAIPPRLTPYH